MRHGSRSRADRRPCPCRPGLDGAASAECNPPCAVSSPGHAPHSPLSIAQMTCATHSGVARASASMHAACGRPAPQTRMGAWSGLRCVRSGLGIDAEHAHRDQRRASRASRNDAPVHACPGPQRLDPIDRRTRCRSPAARIERLGCATPPACSPASIRHARTLHSTLYTHEHREECGTCSGTRSRVSTRAREGLGTG